MTAFANQNAKLESTFGTSREPRLIGASEATSRMRWSRRSDRRVTARARVATPRGPNPPARVMALRMALRKRHETVGRYRATGRNPELRT